MLAVSLAMLFDVVALEVATSRSGMNYVRSHSESPWHKTSQYHYSCDGIQSELSEKALRQKIDLYLKLGGYSEEEEDHLGKDSIWDVAHIIPMCQRAMCHDHKIGKQGRKTAMTAASSKERPNPKHAETTEAMPEKKTIPEKEATPEEASPEEASPEEASPEEASPEEASPEEASPEEPSPEKEASFKENALTTERASSLLHVAEGKDVKQQKVVSRMGTVKGDPVRRLDDSTLSLCISHYLESRCKKQLKGAPNGGETQSMQCFLAQENAEAEAIVNINIQEQLDLVRGKPPCANPEDVLNCDNSAIYEKRFLSQILGIDRDLSKAKCESFTSSDDNRGKNVWGSPQHNPQWMMPRLRCNYNLMHVTLQARKHRLSYMQSWYAKMENELFRSESQWFAQTMRSFTGLSTEPARNTAGRFQDVIERIQKSKKTVDESGSSVKQAASEKLDDELNILRYLDAEKYVPKSGIDIYSPTHQKYSMTSWNYRVSEQGTDSFMSSHGDERKEDEKEFKSLYQSLVEANIDLPAVIGKTRWLDFLQSTSHWTPSFWQLISPANFARMAAQKELTKILCRKLAMEDNEYRTPSASKTLVKKEKVKDHFGQHSATDFGTCSLPLIISRLEAVNAATAEADVPMRTTTYVPSPGEISPLNNALLSGNKGTGLIESEAFSEKIEPMQGGETQRGSTDNFDETSTMDEGDPEVLPQNSEGGRPTPGVAVKGETPNAWDAREVRQFAADAIERNPNWSLPPGTQIMDKNNVIMDDTDNVMTVGTNKVMNEDINKSVNDDVLTKEQNLEEKREKLARRKKWVVAILVAVCIMVLALGCLTKDSRRPLVDNGDDDADGDDEDVDGAAETPPIGSASMDQTSVPPPLPFMPFASEVVPQAED